MPTMPDKCAHGCGSRAGNDGYCDSCYADQCLVGPDGLCRFMVDGEPEVGLSNDDPIWQHHVPWFPEDQ
jgi:hypothetical protein